MKVQEYFKRFCEKLGEIDKTKLAASLPGVVVSLVPVVGPPVSQIVNVIMSDLVPGEKDRLIKELQALSQNQLEEISKEITASFELLNNMHQYTLVQFGQLSAGHHEINQILRHILDTLGIKKIYIPTIQSLLEKERVFEGQFFRKEPKWVDFQEGFIVEPVEVNEIIARLNNDNVQLVLGAPASGKSVLLKYLGFKLANSGFDVYFVQLKTCPTSRIESYFIELQNIDDERTIVIVDDAHLLISECALLIRDFIDKNLKTKLVIGARDVEGFKAGPRESSIYEDINQIEIDEYNVSQDIISLYLNRRFNIVDDSQIQIISEHLEEYKYDLWNLSYAIDSYDVHEESVIKERVYSKIYEYIDKIHGEDIFLPLSIFYRFEIPVWKIFLTKILDINDSEIDDLVAISEINQIEEDGGKLLVLQHSSLASLYLEVYRSKEFFGKKVKDLITEKSGYTHYETGLFHLYFNFDMTNSIDIILKILDSLEYWEDADEAAELRTTINKLVEDHIKSELETRDIKYIMQAMGEFIEHRGIEFMVPVMDVLVSKMGTEDVNNIMYLLRDVVSPTDFEDAELYIDVSNEIESRLIDGILSLIEKEQDIEVIGRLISDADDCLVDSERTEEKIINRINLDVLLKKIEEEKNLDSVIDCVDKIRDISEKTGAKIVNQLPARIKKELEL